MTYLIPHSHEWFKALARINKQQAAQTRQIVSLAGRVDVCGVCGDDPAKDYEILGVTFAPGVPATIRLCEDCKTIRERQYDEKFRAI
jgi:hypothetical protein